MSKHCRVGCIYTVCHQRRAYLRNMTVVCDGGGGGLWSVFCSRLSSKHTWGCDRPRGRSFYSRSHKLAYFSCLEFVLSFLFLDGCRLLFPRKHLILGTEAGHFEEISWAFMSFLITREWSTILTRKKRQSQSLKGDFPSFLFINNNNDLISEIGPSDTFTDHMYDSTVIPDLCILRGSVEQKWGFK